MQHRIISSSSPTSTACTRRVRRQLKKIYKLSKTGMATVVDCGANLDKLAVEADVVFPCDSGGLPPVEQLLAEVAKVLDLLQHGNLVLVVINNARHGLAIASLIRQANGLKEFTDHVNKLQGRFDTIVDDIQMSRDLQVLQTAFQLQQQQASKGQIYLKSIQLTPALLIDTSSYLLLMDESNGLVVHSGNAIRMEEEEGEVFEVNRYVQDGLWITIRIMFGKPEVIRVFLHTNLYAMESTVEFTLQDLLLTQQQRQQQPSSQKPLTFALDDAQLFAVEEAVTPVPNDFRLIVHFTLPPPPPPRPSLQEDDWEEAEQQAGESLLLSSDEVFARRLQLEGDTALEDEMLAWSLFEEELSFTGSSSSSNRNRRAGVDHQQMMAQLPISHFSASGGKTAVGRSCLVCQYAFQPGDTVRTLPCFHHFHPDCCDPWFLHKATCPLCQTSISAALLSSPNKDEEEE
ncbi:hypothetical protein BASA81_015403 [Batrachochytrium salamandrivorans]|nr:hypothetical protein BASA81_015403 [Batrachochytrium salamandrivorans]